MSSGAELVSALPTEVHVLLLDDLLLLLQRQDERLLLKSHSRTLTATPDGKTMLRPVLRLTSAMTRDVATGEAPVHVCPEQGGGLGSGECGEAKGRLGGGRGPGGPALRPRTWVLLSTREMSLSSDQLPWVSMSLGWKDMGQLGWKWRGQAVQRPRICELLPEVQDSA